MSSRAGTLRNAISIDARGIVNHVMEVSIRFWKSSEFEPTPSAQTATANTSTAKVRHSALYENHPLASVSGLLENHPLRDEYLEALGITE